MFTESASAYELCGPCCASAPCYGFAEDVGVVAIVVAELELRDVQRHVFRAHLVERADDAALEDRPEAFNRVGVKQDLQIAYAKLLNENARLVAQIFDLNKENKTLRRDLKRALEILAKARSVK